MNRAAKGAVPGCKGARVYVWEKSNGHYLHRAAGQNGYDNVWREYGPGQRRYDSFYNEWDVCEEFGPEADHDDSDDDDYGADICHQSSAGPSTAPCQSPPRADCTPPLSQLRPTGPDVEVLDEDDHVPSELLPQDEELEEGQYPSEIDLMHAHGLGQLTSEAVEYATIAPSFKEMVYLRFGCTVIEKELETEFDLPTPIVAKKILGDPELQIRDDDCRLQNFCTFLAHCKKGTPASQFPAELLDYRNHNAELYDNDWAVEIRRETLNSQLYYVVFEKSGTRRLYILLQSAATVLKVVSQGWGPSLREVMEALLARGIHFYVCARSDTGKPGPRNWYSGLGLRPQNYSPNRIDYQTYMAIRDKFLQSPRGRATLLYGSVIGCLARAVVAAEEVFRGPTDDATIDGICLWDGHGQLSYWDDALTEQEIDLICGVYHVATGLSLSFHFGCPRY